MAVIVEESKNVVKQPEKVKLGSLIGFNARVFLLVNCDDGARLFALDGISNRWSDGCIERSGDYVSWNALDEYIGGERWGLYDSKITLSN